MLEKNKEIPIKHSLKIISVGSENFYRTHLDMLKEVTCSHISVLNYSRAVAI